MLRLLFCLLSRSLFSISFFSAAAAFAQPELTTDAEQAMQESILLESTAPEYSPLEYQIITDSGLLSLAEQVKYSAQRMIAESSEEQLESQSASGNGEQDAGIAEKIIPINHAQHFAIAKSLAKNWTQAIWQQRLLKLVHSIPLEKQQLIQQQLSMPMILQAQKKEQAAISVQHSVEYQLYMNKLRQRPPSAARWQLVESLDQQSGFSRLIIQARKVVFNQVALQVEGWKPGEFWQNQARQEVLEFLFYAYRKTPNAELKHITDSYNQEELKSLFTTVGNNL